MNEQYGNMLDLNLEDVYEFKTIPADTEVVLRVRNVELAESKAKNLNLHIVLEDPGDPTVEDIHLYMLVPTEADAERDPKAANRAKKRIRDFYDAFDVDWTAGPVDTKEIIGQTGLCIVSEREDDQGQVRNSIRKFVGGK